MYADFFGRYRSFLANRPEAAEYSQAVLLGGRCWCPAMVGTELPTTIGSDLSFGSSFSPWFFVEWLFDFL